MEPRIRPLDDDQAPATSRTLLEQTRKAIGMVPNLHRTLAHAPAALKAYADAGSALSSGRLPARLREQIALASAGGNGCAYCASAHTMIGKNLGLEEAELTRNLGGTSSDARVATLLRFVRALIDERGAVTDAELQAVRDAGFDDEEIVETVAHVALNVFTNTLNVLAQTTIDFPVVQLAGAARGAA